MVDIIAVYYGLHSAECGRVSWQQPAREERMAELRSSRCTTASTPLNVGAYHGSSRPERRGWLN
ncbi:hypothetical protein J6590_007814 [Homalodisca vitripennis]|nr:hypothetical protein J6590_007814 [Homalodisca vitripennis]